MSNLPLRSTPRPAAHPTAPSTGVWVGVATISMSFAAYTSALVVRQGMGTDWLHFQLPAILYVNTIILLASSVSLELARRNHAPAGRAQAPDIVVLPGPASRTASWLSVTLLLGVLFLAGQIVAWRQLASQGLFLATNPSSAFFYILTALHALHLLGGLGGLLYVQRRLRRSGALDVGPALSAATLYWHFMAVLWVFIMLLLLVRL
ncbi:MAG: cytochrome c oxidase subunit 3 [bacterium]